MKNRLKKFLCAILGLLLLLSACTGAPAATDAPDATGGGEEVEQSQPEENQLAPLQDEHLVVLNDIGTGRIVITDLDQENPLDPASFAWTWEPSAKLGWKVTKTQLKDAIDEVKIRWCEFYHTYVVIMTASRSWAGIAEYPSGKCLWEQEVPYSPHSIEMLPNGDVVVASSGGGEWENGRLTYFNITAGVDCRATDEVLVNGAHGVLWDEDGEFLWALGFPVLEAYRIVDSEDGPKFEKIEDKGSHNPSESGHDLTQDATNPDRLWATFANTIHQYSKSEGKFTRDYPYSEYMYAQRITKGVCNFPDGVAVFCNYSERPYTSTDMITAIYPKEDGTYEVREFHSTDGAGWNKVRVFSADYR